MKLFMEHSTLYLEKQFLGVSYLIASYDVHRIESFVHLFVCDIDYYGLAFILFKSNSRWSGFFALTRNEMLAMVLTKGFSESVFTGYYMCVYI